MTGAFAAVGRLLPRSRVRQIEEALGAAGLDVPAESAAGFVMLSSILVSVLAFFSILQFLPRTVPELGRLLMALSPSLSATAGTLSVVILLLACLLIFSGIIILLAYVFLLLRIDARKRVVELYLPDFLQLAAANVRAGMPVDQSLWYAARPEFGLLSQEVELAAKRTFGGEPFAASLDKLAARFNSKYLTRTIVLIKQGMASGGEMGEILERTGIDIKNLQILYKEVSASMLMYIIFIAFASLAGAPFLYAVSYKLVSVLEFIWAQLPPLKGLPSVGLLTPSAPTISSGDFLVFAIAASLLTSLSAALIISIIQTGSKRAGFKLLPVFIFTTLLVFGLILFLLDIWFAGLLR
ncbi:MAG: type II secretion system F family protein [Candidatus Micrarchaeia archaeon]